MNSGKLRTEVGNMMAKQYEKQFRGVPFSVIRDSGTEYYECHITGRLGMMWFTKSELDAALLRAERLRKKYGWE